MTCGTSIPQRGVATGFLKNGNENYNEKFSKTLALLLLVC